VQIPNPEKDNDELDCFVFILGTSHVKTLRKTLVKLDKSAGRIKNLLEPLAKF